LRKLSKQKRRTVLLMEMRHQTQTTIISYS
jgi:hypothetical protein